ncbi:MAG: hypothetical protein ACLVJ6_12100 [Merdibacter sp.]
MRKGTCDRHEHGTLAAAGQRAAADPPATQENGGKTDDLVSRFDIDYANYKLPRLTLLNEAGKKSKSSANLQAAKLKGRQLIDILNSSGSRRR